MRKNSYKILNIQLRRLFLLQFFMAATEALNSAADGIIAGQYLGGDSLGVIALYSPIAILAGLLFVFINGANMMACSYIGRGEVKNVRSVFSTCLVTVVAVSLLLAISVIVFAKPVAALLGAERASTEPMVAYLRGMAIGIPGNAVVGLLMAFLSINNNMRLSYLSVAVSFPVNLIFNFVSVTLFSGSMFGIGLATALSNYCSLAILSAGYRKKAENATLHFSGREFCFNSIGEMLRLGSTKLYMTVSMLISQYLINIRIVNTQGSDGAAVLSVFMIMNMLMSAITSSLVSAEHTLGSIAYSQRDIASFRVLNTISLKHGLLMSAAAGLFLLVFREPVSSLFFIQGTVAWRSCCKMLIFVAFYFQFNIILFALLYMYRSRQKMFMVNAILIENQLCLAAFVAVLVHAPDPCWVWAAFAGNELVSILIVCIYAWAGSKQISLRADVLLGLDDFDMEGYSSFLNTSAATEDDASEISEKLCEIGKREGLPKRIYTNAALCLEELISNMVSHGFKNKSSNHSAQIFCSRHNGDLFIYIWDNGTIFDTKAYMDQFVVRDDDMSRNIGLRIVAKLADELVYQSRFGMNFIMMRFSIG